MWGLVAVFLISYVLIALERPLRIDKSGIVLSAACVLWVMVGFTGGLHANIHKIVSQHLSPIAEIILFLMGAMAIVEIVDSREGFRFLTSRIRTRNKRLLLATLGLMTFLLSSVLDNLATTIVMVAVTLRLVEDLRDRTIVAGIIVVAANAGGAFSPIGDVTTTMLWIGGQVTSVRIISRLVLPSLASFAIPLGLSLLMVRGTFAADRQPPGSQSDIRPWESALALIVGVGSLMAVPVFKILTGLPPFMGMIGALGLNWLLTETLDRIRAGRRTHTLHVSRSLAEIDLPSILFFAGILLSVAALEVGGVLETLAAWLHRHIGNRDLIALTFGFLSSIFDNVPLVAASMRMFPLSLVPVDSSFWHLLAYSAGTGGSMLIIGSAAGVTAMGSTKIGFGEYARRIGPLALLGYLGGALVFFLEAGFTG